MSTPRDQAESSSRRKLGRRKIPMQKIENESNLIVTFSKRKSGVFKKASELGTLTGAEAGIVVFSPGGKAHSFGNPSINSISNKFLAPENISGGDQWREGQDMAWIRQYELNHLARLEVEIAAEKARGEQQAKMRENMIPLGMEGLSYEQLNWLRGAVTTFGSGVKSWVKNMTSGMPVGTRPVPNVGMYHPSGVGSTSMTPYDQSSSPSGSGRNNNGNGGNYEGGW
ncbi:agamous-like MADS-box protein AGL29 [Andrographis paniculata]|uniref:agamous-like MADS-box protein AGL29 n=1 Tax=Andrographis paniculata TaxID=175694 RepID=UPI0021E87631|nr:agamous-like MADS-box protein AGL29 [Andrographis paniculata]